MAQQSTYTVERADEICERIADGEPLRAICRDDHMPAWRTVYAWMEEHPDFAAAIARARILGFDAIAEEAMEIADTPVEGEETEADADGLVTKRRKADMLGHRKLQIETRLKLLAKWDPKRYGDRQHIEHSGQVETATAIMAARKRSGEQS